MNMDALQIQTTLRSWARRLKVTRLLSRMRNVAGAARADYESAFSLALLEVVHVGDCVWDVGANIGFYTRLLKDRVGPEGLVCAFEPNFQCYEKLLSERGTNARIFNIALGDVEMELALALAEDPLGTTHSLVGAQSGKSVMVRVLPGDRVVGLHNLRIPNVIKIDVEGFEEEVIAGLATTLINKDCRAVFCEVHFGILDQKGARHAPGRIEKTLKGYGFATRWVDPSHLAAVRQTNS